MKCSKSRQPKYKQENQKKSIPLLVTGLIISIFIILYNALLIISNLISVGDLNYPKTAITPIVMYILFFISGIIILINSIIQNKRIWISVILLFVVGSALFPISKTINQKITRADAAPQSETDEQINDYQDNCSVYTFDDLSKKDIGTKVKYIGEVQQVISESDSFSEYLVNITRTSTGYKDTVYLIFPHYEDKTVELVDEQLISFYGFYAGKYTYTNKLGTEITVPKISALYLSNTDEKEEEINAIDFSVSGHLSSYNEIINLCKSDNDQPIIKFKGRIETIDYRNGNVVLLVNMNNDYSDDDLIVGATYRGSELIENDSFTEYTFYGMPVTMTEAGELTDENPVVYISQIK